MKPLFVILAMSVSAMSASEPKTIDPKTLSFSVATLNDALPTLDPGAEVGSRDLVIHEDDWRQFEAVSRALDAAIQEELSDVRRVFQEKSKIVGGRRIFSEIHIRKRVARPFSALLAWSELLAATGAETSSVAGLALAGQGVVKDGFSFRVGQFTLFGIRHGERVDVLCFEFTRTPGLSEAEARRFAAFAEKSEIVVVHWPSASVLKDSRALTNYLMQRREKND